MWCWEGKTSTSELCRAHVLCAGAPRGLRSSKLRVSALCTGGCSLCGAPAPFPMQQVLPASCCQALPCLCFPCTLCIGLERRTEVALDHPVLGLSVGSGKGGFSCGAEDALSNELCSLPLGMHLSLELPTANRGLMCVRMEALRASPSCWPGGMHGWVRR